VFGILQERRVLLEALRFVAEPGRLIILFLSPFCYPIAPLHPSWVGRVTGRLCSSSPGPRNAAVSKFRREMLYGGASSPVRWHRRTPLSLNVLHIYHALHGQCHASELPWSPPYRHLRPKFFGIPHYVPCFLGTHITSQKTMFFGTPHNFPFFWGSHIRDTGFRICHRDQGSSGRNLVYEG